jgi:hypothetical protein
MNKNNVYDKWKEHRKQVHLNENFSYSVMDRIYGYENTGDIKAAGVRIPDSHAILNWLLRFALTLGLLALNYQWAYGRLM